MLELGTLKFSFSYFMEKCSLMELFPLSKFKNGMNLIKSSCKLCLPPHQIREGLLDNGIAVYPQKEFDEDAEDRGINDKIRVRAATAWRVFRTSPATPPRL